MGSEIIRRDLQEFQASLSRLSAGIGGASALWSDEKYAELSSAVRELAGQSRDVLAAGDQCCVALDRFARIAEEKY